MARPRLDSKRDRKRYRLRMERHADAWRKRRAGKSDWKSRSQAQQSSKQLGTE